MPYYEGQPIPRGYKIGSEPRYWAVAAGGVGLGLFWIASAMVGIGLQEDEDRQADSYSTYPGAPERETETFWPLVFPVVGPFIALGTTDAEGIGMSILALDGLMQTAAATLLIVGLAAQEDVLVWSPGETSVQLTASPIMVGSNGAGVGLGGRF